MKPSAVVASRLSKSYRLYDRPWQRLIEGLTGRPSHRPLIALDEVSFEVAPGGSLGIIGENGAGKTTLLKILAGVTRPSTGNLQMMGKVAAILELGSAFHPEFTGRQNVRINAALHGLSPGKIEERMPEILRFSELGDFIDQPVKVYSTGMVMRLAFSIATQVEPDVLVVDEALSVGDGYFQKKCMDRIQELVQSGVTLIFCSHAMYYVGAFCERALWLRDGRVAAYGPARDVIATYERFLLEKSIVREETESGRPREGGDVDHRPVHLISVRPLPAKPGSSWQVELEWTSESSEAQFHTGIALDRVDGVQICAFSSHWDGLPPVSGQHHYCRRLNVPALPLQQGDFTLYAYVLDEAGLHVYDQFILKDALQMRSEEYRVGLLDLEHEWQDAAPEEAAERRPAGETLR